MWSTKHSPALPIAQSVTTITVAGILLEGRATARIPHILRPCFGSPSAGRAANDTSSPISSLATTPSARRNASNSTLTPPRGRDNPRDSSPYDLAGLQYDPIQAAEEATGGDGPPSRPDTSRDAYRRWANQKARRFLDASIPPVTTGRSRDAPRTPRTVHILGNDRRASFLACELRQVYDSVHVFKSVDEKLVDFKFEPSNSQRDPAMTRAEDRQQEQLLSPATSETNPITNLITTARAVDAVSAIGQLKDRISDQTTLCLMNEGLGVAEDLNETVFNEDAGAKPEYLLGRLDRGYLKREKLGKTDSIDQPPSGNKRGLIHAAPLTKAQFSPYDPDLETHPGESPLASSLIDEFKKMPNLEVNHLAYHNWLHLKLKEMVIYSVVDPVAAVVGCRYQETTENKWAMHLMMMILEELRRVIAVLPEVHISARIRMLTEPQYLRKALFERLRRLPPGAGSMMGAHIRAGWKVDINAHNGYFIRRGKKLGVECPYNEMIVAMVKAKYGMHMKERDKYVPFEITSRPHRDKY